MSVGEDDRRETEVRDMRLFLIIVGAILVAWLFMQVIVIR